MARKLLQNLRDSLDRLNCLKVVVAFFLVAFGQPAWSDLLSMVSAAIGYALFWSAILPLQRRFWVTFGWFAAVQAVQIGWISATEYMGLGILFVYAFLILSIGLQFAWMTSFIRLPLSWMQTLGVAGFWVLMEWMRLIPLTGFPWNPAGFALAGNSYSIQFAALLGVYGLSFWVIWVNLLGLKALLEPTNKKRWAAWASFALFPYAFGFVHQTVWQSRLDSKNTSSVALVQTGLKPEEKEYSRSEPSAYIAPIAQWGMILDDLDKTGERSFDLIVLPEGVVPFNAARAYYSLEAVETIWKHRYGESGLNDFPPLEEPFAKEVAPGIWRVTNAFWAQSLSNRYQAELIAGFSCSEQSGVYNSAFYFSPGQTTISRYDKQILVPVGEYIPLGNFSIVKQFVTSQYEMGEPFKPGNEVKIFSGKRPIGVSICSEETYSHLVREIRRAGAEMFVNITNDVWFPETRLPWHHFTHGKIRAAENGVSLLRSCNMGVTGAVDCFGRNIQLFSEQASGALPIHLPSGSIPTLYTMWGDWAIFLSSGLFVLVLLIRKKKLP